MRLSTTGNQEYRNRYFRQVMERTGQQTKSGAIDYALEFTIAHLDRLERAKNHRDMTPELAEALSSDLARIELEQRSELTINE